LTTDINCMIVRMSAQIQTLWWNLKRNNGKIEIVYTENNPAGRRGDAVLTVWTPGSLAQVLLGAWWYVLLCVYVLCRLRTDGYQALRCPRLFL
jgi:hypothetical protein